jgi:hypothetical protein
MKHEEYVELVKLAMLNQTDLSHMIRTDKRRLSDSMTGERGWKYYEDAVCKILAIRARTILCRLKEYGHEDK